MPTVRLRPTTERDLDLVLAAEADPDNRRFILPWTQDRHSAALRDPDIAHRIAENEEGVAVGFVILAGLLNPDACIEFRRVVVTEKGKGHGRSIVRAVKQIAFEELKAHRLWLEVKETNGRARRLYQTEAFVEEGVLRECLRSGQVFESLVLMSQLAHEYHTA